MNSFNSHVWAHDCTIVITIVTTVIRFFFNDQIFKNIIDLLFPQRVKLIVTVKSLHTFIIDMNVMAVLDFQ